MVVSAAGRRKRRPREGSGQLAPVEPCNLGISRDVCDLEAITELEISLSR